VVFLQRAEEPRLSGLRLWVLDAGYVRFLDTQHLGVVIMEYLRLGSEVASDADIIALSQGQVRTFGANFRFNFLT